MPGKEDFSGFEVIRAAMEVEKQGRRFYSSMASKAPSEQTREVFALLAEDEITHLKTLEDMIHKYQDAAYWENEEEFVPYLRQFSAEQVFPSAEQVEAVVASGQAEIQSLELALVAEEKFAEYF
ncbi:MAG: ferritin family protein, partial [Desulfuromonadaceae bacterium]